MKLYITKYALTTGIMEVDGEVCSSTMVAWDRNGGCRDFAHRNDWHYTKAGAMDRADDMRRDKIKGLQKQIDKLKKLDFGGGKA